MSEEKEIIKRKHIINWLHIMLNTKTTDLNKLANEISKLNHQIRYYKKMAECHQDSVIDDLNVMFMECGMNREISKKGE